MPINACPTEELATTSARPGKFIELTSIDRSGSKGGVGCLCVYNVLAILGYKVGVLLSEGVVSSDDAAANCDSSMSIGGYIDRLPKPSNRRLL